MSEPALGVADVGLRERVACICGLDVWHGCAVRGLRHDSGRTGGRKCGKRRAGAVEVNGHGREGDGRRISPGRGGILLTPTFAASGCECGQPARLLQGWKKEREVGHGRRAVHGCQNCCMRHRDVSSCAPRPPRMYTPPPHQSSHTNLIQCHTERCTEWHIASNT
eukprot:355730-Chlamydomonas_euryale.AAC.1